MLCTPQVFWRDAWSVVIGALTITTAAPAQSLGTARLIRAFADTPVPSPDSRHFVYIAIVAGKEQLWLMRTDGSDPRQITHDLTDHEDPDWSPDGGWIAYTSIADSSEMIMVMRADGSDAHAVSPRTVRAIHPSWSPDGRRVLYCTDDDLKPPAKNDSQIFSVELASGKTTLIISGGVNTYPVLSHDGSMIAFRRMIGEKNSEVFIARANGSDVRNISNNEAFDGWPAWSPDGKRIAFASNRNGNGNYQVFTMNRAGGDVRLIANTTGRATAPHWSLDGRTIYFTNCYRKGAGFECDALAAPATGVPAPTH